MEKLAELNMATDEMILKRYKELNERELETVHYHDEINCVENGFIPDYLEISIHNLIRLRYSLKGIDYLDYYNYIKSKIDFNDNNYIAKLVYETMQYVKNYFKMDFYNNEKDVRLLLLEYDSDGKDFDYVSSISIFKGNGTGRCSEHALLLQNLLSFMGIPVTFFSTVEKTDDQITGHAFNIVQFNGRNILIDLVNVNILENLRPVSLVTEISNEDYDTLINGGIIEIERTDITRENGKRVSQYILLDQYYRNPFRS